MHETPLHPDHELVQGINAFLQLLIMLSQSPLKLASYYFLINKQGAPILFIVIGCNCPLFTFQPQSIRLIKNL